MTMSLKAEPKVGALWLLGTAVSLLVACPTAYVSGPGGARTGLSSGLVSRVIGRDRAFR
jgi:hypothetical protein